ncbi:MAG: DUF2085 domain-containing protein, partial [Methanobacteriota archaeon]
MERLQVIWTKMKWSRALLVMFGITLFWVVSLFAAPLSLAPGTFAFTTGGANVVDHWNLYQGAGFNWFAKVIYTIGDAQCHQLWYRSLWINGNQFPIDARMTSLYIFGAFGLFWAMMAAPAASASQGIANGSPGRIRRWAVNVGLEKFALLVVFAGLLPIGIDGFTQLFSAVTHYESTNAMRILTGVPGGLVSGLLLGMMVKAIKQFDVEYRVMRARTSLLTP